MIKVHRFLSVAMVTVDESWYYTLMLTKS